jgi:hypothetical protein
MKRLNWNPSLAASAILLAHPAIAQGQLGVILTKAFGVLCALPPFKNPSPSASISVYQRFNSSAPFLPVFRSRTAEGGCLFAAMPDGPLTFP